jgi:hypothetical protein
MKAFLLVLSVGGWGCGSASSTFRHRGGCWEDEHERCVSEARDVGQRCVDSSECSYYCECPSEGELDDMNLIGACARYPFVVGYLLRNGTPEIYVD